MNQALEDVPKIESDKNALVWDPSIDDQNSNHFDRTVSCLDCKGLTFENAKGLHKHLRDLHVQYPIVLLQRLSPEYLQKLKQKKGRQRKGAFARKRSHSYIQPRVKSSKKSPLKLKLKVSGDSSSRSFEVVPQTVLIGPGGIYPLNGCDIGEVKTEDLLTDVEWNKSLEGATELPEVANSGGRTFDEVPESCEKENSGDSLGSNDDVLGDKVSDVSNFQQNDSGDVLPIEKEELDIPPSPEPNLPESSLPSPEEAIPSPLQIPHDADDDLSPDSNEQLERELLHSDSESNFPHSPNMVEINNSTVADVHSPSFPTPSPSDPSGQPTPPADQQSNDGQSCDENSPVDQGVSGSDQLPCDDDADGANTENFVWTDVAASDGDMNADNSVDPSLEERDPLLLNDNASSSAEECRSNLQGSPSTGSIDGSDQSILRGFLAEHGSERSNAPPSGVGGLEGFGLGSEYISLERLGDNAVICDVCGERAADQSALQDHKFRSGHFKCAQPECGGVVFSSSDELLSHQQSVHGSPQFSQSNILSQSQPIINQQSAPVQQLVQQVQRLPVPQMTMQTMNKNQPPISAAMSQQLSSGMVTLIASQQNQYQGAVCRPPPLYPAPAANLMQQHGAPPPYPGQPQHVMFPQPYPHGQAYPGSPRQPVQMQPRPYSTMMQQMTQHNIRQQVPRVSAPNISRNMATNQGSPVQGVKRGVPVSSPSSSSPGSKQRRMDMLIPDRHDDADCHVIAMQKRTESGPVITGVQGSTPNNSPGANRQSQSDSTINLTDSITLSVRQQNAGATNGGSKGRNDANTVASLLATRGITVTPAGGSVRGQPPPQSQSQQSPVQHRTRQPVAPPPAPPPPAPQPVTTLNLNSAISIIPTASVRPSKQQQQQQMQQPQAPSTNFAVPQGRTANRPQQQAQVERPPRPPTVDLTGDGPPPPPSLTMMGRGRGRGRGGLLGRHMCQLCDKPFPSLDALNQHMITHRPGKLPFRCNMCAAQYPTQQGLLQHRQTYHKESPSQTGSELVLPVVDLKQPATLNRLNSLGVRHYIPLSQLSNQSGGVLGLPIVSLEGGRIPSTSLSALGAATILTLGPLRQLPR